MNDNDIDAGEGNFGRGAQPKESRLSFDWQVPRKHGKALRFLKLGTT